MWTATRKGQSLDDAAADKIRNYRADYNRPPSAVSFIPPIPSTSDRLHSEFVRILHRETDHFFAASGVQLVCAAPFILFQFTLKKKTYLLEINLKLHKKISSK
jgi:hypothetical protein